MACIIMAYVLMTPFRSGLARTYMVTAYITVAYVVVTSPRLTLARFNILVAYKGMVAYKGIPPLAQLWPAACAPLLHHWQPVREVFAAVWICGIAGGHATARGGSWRRQATRQWTWAPRRSSRPS